MKAICTKHGLDADLEVDCGECRRLNEGLQKPILKGKTLSMEQLRSQTKQIGIKLLHDAGHVRLSEKVREREITLLQGIKLAQSNFFVPAKYAGAFVLTEELANSFAI